MRPCRGNRLGLGLGARGLGGRSAAGAREAGKDRLRGVRYYATYHDSDLKTFIPSAQPNIMGDASFRRGSALLDR